MMMERTFAMIKPDAVKAGNVGNIIALIENNGFSIVKMDMRQLSKATAQEFYAVHRDRPFFDELVTFIISGPVVVLELKRDHAVKTWRDLMGATNPAQAAHGTVRKLYAASIGENAVHGSDAPETAAQELKLIFG
jgi:nucleoside-diphosphate kinase